MQTAVGVHSSGTPRWQPGHVHIRTYPEVSFMVVYLKSVLVERFPLLFMIVISSYERPYLTRDNLVRTYFHFDLLCGTPFVDGVYEVDSISPVLWQACGLPWSHDATGRKAGCTPTHHKLHEEVSYRVVQFCSGSRCGMLVLWIRPALHNVIGSVDILWSIIQGCQTLSTWW